MLNGQWEGAKGTWVLFKNGRVLLSRLTRFCKSIYRSFVLDIRLHHASGAG